MNRKAWRAAALAAPTLGFVLVLAATEVGVRRWLPRVEPIEVFVRDPHQRMGFTDRRHVRVFEADPLLLWRVVPDLRGVVWDFTPLTTNAQGLRMDHDLAPKPPGRFRVVCVGDSVTFGYRVPVVFPEAPARYDRNARPYPAELAHLLGAAHGDVEVVPLAAPGYSSHQGRLWAERELAGLEPDVVTALFGWNDANLRAAPDEAVFAADPLRLAARRGVIASQALAHAAQWLGTWWEPRGSAGALVPRVDARGLVANYRAIGAAARAAGARFVAIAPVFQGAGDDAETTRISVSRQALVHAMSADGTPCLEIPALTERGRPDNSALFGEPIHPNAPGHRLLARALARLLEERGLLATASARPAG